MSRDTRHAFPRLIAEYAIWHGGQAPTRTTSSVGNSGRTASSQPKLRSRCAELLSLTVGHMVATPARRPPQPVVALRLPDWGGFAPESCTRTELHSIDAPCPVLLLASPTRAPSDAGFRHVLGRGHTPHCSISRLGMRSKDLLPVWNCFVRVVSFLPICAHSPLPSGLPCGRPRILRSDRAAR